MRGRKEQAITRQDGRSVSDEAFLTPASLLSKRRVLLATRRSPPGVRRGDLGVLQHCAEKRVRPPNGVDRIHGHQSSLPRLPELLRRSPSRFRVACRNWTAQRSDARVLSGAELPFPVDAVFRKWTPPTEQRADDFLHFDQWRCPASRHQPGAHAGTRHQQSTGQGH